ncbi:Glutaredoxin-like protein NrdH, required for reduction of Ribonucleotide reductase class Ib [Kocuria palustris PEL]|uniref:Glutaredoxin-like protein NrdH n=1 Tax=Kocuria palustris PEL TaxID=1236550 RepID=M2XUS2_9MICC|nr:glutaredoxin-like protein NrdH [Kocuria palustris]EME36563.1 Glutaredoxin-like protein NrdH, required for reduction of Ribonucleotide reductase class Ib [Kocuria palustris PEL]
MQQITVYSKPGCVQCQATMRKLDKRGAAYEVRDVTQDQDAYAHVRELGYQQVPVVEVGQQHWSGFRPDKISGL